MRPAWRRMLLFAWMAAAGGLPLRGAGAEGAETPATPTVDDALLLLRSPFLSDREQGIRRVADRLPAETALVRAALEREPSLAVRFALAEALARDGSAGSLEALLDAVAKGPEVVSTRVRSILLRQPGPARAALEAWSARRPDDLPEPLRVLDELLLRAEVQAIFVSRKSKSGYTGYYRGQYAPLDTPRYREVALRTCVHVLEDAAMPVPGVHRAGGFEFAVAPAESVEFAEVQGMAANAVVELTRTTRAEAVDAWVLARLEMLRERRDLEYRVALALWRSGYRSSHALYLAKEEKRGQYTDVLLAAALLYPRRHMEEVELLLEDLSRYGSDPNADDRAAVLLRLGRYAEAIREFERLVRDPESLASRANVHYNLACAYASWSLEPGDEDPADLRREALRNLTRAVVEHRWSDVGWMEQDRDLDPIRDTPQYRALLAHIRDFLLPPKKGAK